AAQRPDPRHAWLFRSASRTGASQVIDRGGKGRRGGNRNSLFWIGAILSNFLSVSGRIRPAADPYNHGPNSSALDSVFPGRTTDEGFPSASNWDGGACGPRRVGGAGPRPVDRDAPGHDQRRAER